MVEYRSAVFTSSFYLRSPFEFALQAEPKSMNHLVIGVGSVESAYLVSATPSMTQHDHEDLPALMVLIQYLTQVSIDVSGRLSRKWRLQ